MTIEDLYVQFQQSTGVTTDTRKIKGGEIFFALRGENFNGNEYAAEAIGKGCVLAVVDDPIQAKGESMVVVSDALQTLQALAAMHRKQFKGTVIGLTGSNGKTTSKELLRDVLASTYKVYATKGNLNNHIGVPLSLLCLEDQHEFAVIEMGANAQGEIRMLSAICDPDFGFITNMGKAHLEGFGGIEGVKKGKSELYIHLFEKGAPAFVNAADETLMERSTNVDRIPYGTSDHPPYVYLTQTTPTLHFQWEQGAYKSEEIPTQLTGTYNLGNISAAVAIGKYFDVPEANINRALSGYKPSNNRSEIRKTKRNTIVVDCYNANPTSMEHALESFREMKAEKKLCILGDMFELGDVSVTEHKKIMSLSAEMDLDCLFVGEEFARAAPPAVSIFHTTDVLKKALEEGPLTGYTILLKGSRGMALERLIEVL